MKITKTFDESKIMFDITEMSPQEYDAICYALLQVTHTDNRNKHTLLATKIVRVIEVYENSNTRLFERGATNGKEENNG